MNRQPSPSAAAAAALIAARPTESRAPGKARRTGGRRGWISTRAWFLERGIGLGEAAVPDGGVDGHVGQLDRLVRELDAVAAARMEGALDAVGCHHSEQGTPVRGAGAQVGEARVARRGRRRLAGRVAGQVEE